MDRTCDTVCPVAAEKVIDLQNHRCSTKQIALNSVFIDNFQERTKPVSNNSSSLPTASSPTVRLPGAGKTVIVVGDVYRFLATGAETNGRYAMWEAIVPPGGGPPPHVHSREEESFLVLEGEITFQIGEEQHVARTGTFANMPVGVLHSFKNASDQPAKMIISVAPAGLEQMFFEVGKEVPSGTLTAAPVTREEIGKLLEIAPRYGIEIKVPSHGHH
jgi:quercetin dioxygenase-like cupin family protein